jgi:hypothetical protein
MSLEKLANDKGPPRFRKELPTCRNNQNAARQLRQAESLEWKVMRSSETQEMACLLKELQTLSVLEPIRLRLRLQ